MPSIKYLTRWFFYKIHLLPDRRQAVRPDPLGEHIACSLRVGTVCIALVAAPRVASAASDSCSISGATMAFGTYQVFQATPLQSMTQLIVTCTRGKTLKIMMDASEVSGSYMQRQMKRVNGTDLLSYNLYRDASRVDVWGPKGSSKEHFKDVGTYNQIVVYGSIPAGQDVAAGEYLDTVVVTIDP